MVRRLIAPTLWLLAGLGLAVLSWTTGQTVSALVACLALVGFAAGWFVRRLRPASWALPVLAGVLVTALGIGLPWGLAYRDQYADVAWTMPSRSKTPIVVSDRIYLLRDGDDKDPSAWLEVRDLRSGKHLWSREFPEMLGGSTTRLSGVRVAEDGSVILRASPDPGPSNVFRLSPTGRLVWWRETGAQVVAATARTTVLRSCPVESPDSCRLEGLGQRGERRWTMSYEHSSPRWVIPPDEGDTPELTLPSVVAVVEQQGAMQRATLVDADTGRRRGQVDAPIDERLSWVVAQGRYVWVLAPGRTGCAWSVLDATRRRSVRPSGPCQETLPRVMPGDQVMVTQQVASDSGYAWLLDLARGSVRALPFAQGALTTPEVAIRLDDSELTALDPATGRRLWSATPSPDVGDDVTVGESVVRVSQDAPRSGNPFLGARDQGDVEAIELLAPRSGKQLAATTCPSSGDVEAVGADWALVSCGSEYRLLTSR